MGFAFAALIGASVPLAAQSTLPSQESTRGGGSTAIEKKLGPSSAARPGSEAAVRKLVIGLINGKPDYESMVPEFARLTRFQLPDLQQTFSSLGELRSINFRGVDDAMGADEFQVSFARGGMVMAVALNPQGQVAGAMFRPAPGTILQPATDVLKLEGAALIKAFNARAQGYADSGDFSGAVLLAKNGQVLFQKAYGFANRDARKPNRLNTQFRFGSMGKLFTMVAIMQLAQDGKIDPSSPIGRYLPGYPNQDVATKVTVSNLLTHTGGTGDIFGPDFEAHKTSLRDHKDYVALYGRRSLKFAPGSRSAYSNYGFILLGRIVEEVSGLTYDQYLQRNIFATAGMSSTGNAPESDRLPRRAVGYMGFGGNLKPADEFLPLAGTSAGGGYSTVGDFKRFVDALVSHRLIRAETLEKLATGGVTAPDGTFYPYDFGATMPGSGRFMGHGGGAPGMNGDLLHFPDSGYTIVVLANRDPPVAQSIAGFLATRLPAK
jgi:CubicO group peptidase (beta-lactamase class C family)